MPGSRLYGPGLKLDGAELDASWTNLVETVVVDKALNQPASAEVRFVVPVSFVEPSELITPTQISKVLEITGYDPDGNGSVLFTGEITAVGQEYDSGVLSISIYALDKARRLDNGRQFKASLNQKPSDIISAMAGDVGLSPSIDTIGEPQDHVQQYISDREMLDDLTGRYGLDWWLEGSTLNVKKPATSGTTHTLDDANVRRISARFDGTHTNLTASVRDWDAAKQEAIVGKGTVTKPSWVGKPADPAGLKVDPVSPTNPALTQAEAKLFASARGREAVEEGGWCEVECELMPTVKLAELATVEQALLPVLAQTQGELRIVGIEHRLSAGSESTTLSLAGNERTDLAQMVLDAPSAPTWAERGPVIGVVTNVTDPDKLGRVKVKYPQLDDKLESGWARVLTARAGSEAGTITPLAIDDEVLILFQNGDARRPIVIGGVYSAKNKPPSADEIEQREASYVTSVDGKAKLKLFSGKESAANTELMLSIEAGKTDGKLRIYEENGLLELAKGTLKITVADKGSSITITDTGEIKIDSKDKLTLSATKDVTIKGANVKIESQQNLDVKGGTKATVDSSAGTTVKSGAITEIKGSMVKVN